MCAIRLFVPPFIKANKTEKPALVTFERETSGNAVTSGFPSQRDNNTERVSMACISCHDAGRVGRPPLTLVPNANTGRFVSLLISYRESTYEPVVYIETHHAIHMLARIAGRPHERCAGSGSTNHPSADRMSGQFLFYHENEAIHNDKSRDDHDDEPPCSNALAGNAIVVMKASIDTVSE